MKLKGQGLIEDNSMTTTKLMTVIIPSHVRHAHIERILFNLRKLPCVKIVVDSSPDAMPEERLKVFEGVHYYHKENYSLIDKIRFASGLVKTPYVLATPDDDLYSVKGISAMLLHISENPVCNTVSGQQIAFKVVDGATQYCLKHSGEFLVLSKRSIEERIKGRLSRVMTPYFQTLWAIHNADHYMDFFRSDLSWIKSPAVFEVYFKIFMALHGDCAVCPVMFSAREVENRIGPSTNNRNNPPVPFRELYISGNEAERSEIRKCEELLAEVLSGLTDDTLERSRKYVAGMLKRFSVYGSKNNPNLIQNPVDRFEAMSNPDLSATPSRMPKVISNDYKGKSFYKEKALLPVYSEEHAGCLMEFENAIAKYISIYSSRKAPSLEAADAD